MRPLPPLTALPAFEATAGLIERRLVEKGLKDEHLLAAYGLHRVGGGFGAFVPELSQDKPSVMARLDWLASVASPARGCFDGRALLTVKDTL